jgi:VanZ family protein
MLKKSHPLYVTLGVLMTLSIWINSLLPATLSGEQSGFFVSLALSITNWMRLDIPYETMSLWVRKLAHFTQFFIFGLLWIQALKPSDLHNKQRYLYVFIFGFVVAIIDEGIQLFTPGRAGTFIDILIDVFGVFAALIISYLWFDQKGRTSTP